MALGSCYTCIKYLMFAFNFIFWLLGCAILGIAIWIRVDDSSAEFVHQSPHMELFYILAYIMMVIGFIIMFIGFLGCCGAIRESQCMLATFFLCLFIIFAALLSFGIWVVVAKESFRETVEDALKEGVEDYGNPKKKATDFMDSVQNYFECCGWEKGAADYTNVTPPPSCAGRPEPCTDKFFKWIEDKMIIIASSCIGVAVTMILGMIFSMVLCCAIRDTLA